jgi:hypothetical protein
MTVVSDIVTDNFTGSLLMHCAAAAVFSFYEWTQINVSPNNFKYLLQHYIHCASTFIAYYIPIEFF